MKVRSELIPDTELIREALPKPDFSDAFSTTNGEDGMETLSRKIFGTTPGWVKFLFRIRNFFARLIGLKTDPPENINRQFEVGGFVSFFEIYEISENEVILGADDSHLKFRVSILNTNSKDFNIKVTTLVEYVNRTGKIYMFIVGPFHKILVRRMVRQAYIPNK